MTDTKSDHTSDSGGAPQHNKTVETPRAAPTGARPAKRSRRSGVVIAVVILLLIIAALGATVWYQQRTMHERDQAVQNQVQQSAQSAQVATEQSMQALSLARRHTSELDQVQASLTETQQQLHSLEQALQTLTDSGTDIALINDMDQLVSIAHQQLLLGGNVSNAIIALETAQARLARANRPGLASLQQAINGDVERLRAVSTVDINRLSSRIDELGRLIEAAPLLIPDDAAPAVAASPSSRAGSPAPVTQAPDPAAPWWKQSLSSAANWSKQAWWTIKQDLAGFISVRRVDDAAALLLSPEQASGLREKLRLRLMTAQLALLMKQPDVWQTETRAVVQLLQARYDINSVDGHRALRLALQLADTSIHVEMPSVANSQSAIQTLREEHARSTQAASNADDAAEEAGASAQGNGAQSADQAEPNAQNDADHAEPSNQNDADQSPASNEVVPQNGEDAAPEPSNGAGASDTNAPAADQEDQAATASLRTDQAGV